jgi:hypothetical protein
MHVERVVAGAESSNQAQWLSGQREGGDVCVCVFGWVGGYHPCAVGDLKYFGCTSLEVR